MLVEKYIEKMKRRFETTCSAEQALEEVFRLIENDDGDDDDVENQIHDDLCELGTDVDFVTDQTRSNKKKRK